MSIYPQVVERNCNCFISTKTLLLGKSYPAYRGNSVPNVTGTCLQDYRDWNLNIFQL